MFSKNLKVVSWKIILSMKFRSAFFPWRRFTLRVLSVAFCFCFNSTFDKKKFKKHRFFFKRRIVSRVLKYHYFKDMVLSSN